MHKVDYDQDNIKREFHDYIAFQKRTEELHYFAETLDGYGFRTEGLNDELFCIVDDFVIKPTPVLNGKEVIVSIPILKTGLRMSFEKFLKTFNNKSGYAIKAIKENISTVREYNKAIEQLLKSSKEKINVALAMDEV